MAVLNAQYKHPQSAYSQGLKDLIDSMLKVNPTDRPDINEVSNILLCFLSCLLIYCCSKLGHPAHRRSSSTSGVRTLGFSHFIFYISHLWLLVPLCLYALIYYSTGLILCFFLIRKSAENEQRDSSIYWLSG